MKTIKELEKEIENLKFELKLKDRVDNKCARFDNRIRISEEKLKSLKEVLEEMEKVEKEMFDESTPEEEQIIVNVLDNLKEKIEGKNG